MSDYICHDLQASILKWLPVKTLFRFKCVSKSWKLHIESDSFAQEHLSVQNPLVIVQNQTWNDLKIFDPRTPPFSTRNLTHPNGFLIGDKANPYDVVNTLHGIICLYDFNYTTGRILLWNPSIRRFLTVPLRSPALPTHCHKICGFWIEPSCKHFKVLLCELSPVREAKAQTFALYSSRDQGWKEVSMPPIRGTIFMERSRRSEVLIDKVVHWMALRYYCGSAKDNIVVSFDFDQEKLEIIELPEELQPKCCYVNLCKWQGSCSVVRCKVGNMGTSSSCTIWAMRNKSWSEMLSFDIIGTIYQVFCVLDDSVRVLASAWNGSGCELILCDSVRQIHLQPNIVCKDMFSLASDFVESLVFPDPNGHSSGY